MQFIATCGCQGAVLESNSHINRMTYFTYIHLSEQKKSSSQKQKSSQMEESVHIPWPWSIWDLLVFPPKKNPRKRASSCCNSPFTLKRPSPEAGRAQQHWGGGKLLHVLSGGLQILHMQYTLENERRGGGPKEHPISWWFVMVRDGSCLDTRNVL